VGFLFGETMNYLFDIDGTLTLPRQPIEKNFEEFFFNWMQGKKVYFVTGSDMKKVKEQLSQRIIDSCAGIFCSMANEFYINGELQYSNKLKISDDVVAFLRAQLYQSDYSPKRTNNFEYRAGMLNFSIAGRDSSNEEREKYYLYDIKTKERKNIANFINKNYGQTLEARIGGQISIDIQNVGNNKSLASKWIRKNIGGKILFFGDKTDKDGNDYDIVKDIIDVGDGEWYSIKDPSQLKMILEIK
jgi:phosphomannomutase